MKPRPPFTSGPVKPSAKMACPPRGTSLSLGLLRRFQQSPMSSRTVLCTKCERSVLLCLTWALSSQDCAPSPRAPPSAGIKGLGTFFPSISTLRVDSQSGYASLAIGDIDSFTSGTAPISDVERDRVNLQHSEYVSFLKPGDKHSAPCWES